MDNYLNDPRLQQAQTQAQQAGTTANASAQQDVSLPQMLKDTLNAKFNDNNPLVSERNNAATAYLSSIPSSYNDVLPQNNNGVILSPTQQAMMIQSKQNAYLSPLMSANSRLATQRGSLADVIQSVTQAHKSSTEALAQKAQLAHQSYKDILDELSTKADQAYKLQALSETTRHNKADEANQALMAARRYNMLTPGQQLKLQQTIGPVQEGLSQIQDARNALTKTGSGPKYSLYQLRSKLPGGLGGFGSDDNNTISTLSQANTNLFKLAGTQFTKGESGLLKGIVIDPTKDTQANMAALDKYQRSFNNHLATLYGMKPSNLDSLRKKNYKEDQISEYLMSQM